MRPKNDGGDAAPRKPRSKKVPVRKAASAIGGAAKKATTASKARKPAAKPGTGGGQPKPKK